MHGEYWKFSFKKIYDKMKKILKETNLTVNDVGFPEDRYLDVWYEGTIQTYILKLKLFNIERKENIEIKTAKLLVNYFMILEYLNNKKTKMCDSEEQFFYQMEWTLKQIKFIVQSAEFYIGGGIPIKEKSYSKNTKYQNGKTEETYEDTVEYVNNYFYNPNKRSKYYESTINTYINEEICDEGVYEENDYEEETYEEDDYREEDEETDEREEDYNKENEDYMDEDYFKEILDDEIIYESSKGNCDKEYENKIVEEEIIEGSDSNEQYIFDGCTGNYSSIHIVIINDKQESMNTLEEM